MSNKSSIERIKQEDAEDAPYRNAKLSNWKSEILLTSRQKRRMVRILTGKRISMAQAAKIRVFPICDVTDKDIAETYENDPAYKEPEDDKTNVLRRDPREEKQ